MRFYKKYLVKNYKRGFYSVVLRQLSLTVTMVGSIPDLLKIYFALSVNNCHYLAQKFPYISYCTHVPIIALLCCEDLVSSALLFCFRFLWDFIALNHALRDWFEIPSSHFHFLPTDLLFFYRFDATPPKRWRNFRILICSWNAYRIAKHYYKFCLERKL